MYNYVSSFCFGAVEVAVVARLHFGLNLDDDSSPAAAGRSLSGLGLTMYFCRFWAILLACGDLDRPLKVRERQESVIDGHSGWASRKCCSMLYVRQQVTACICLVIYSACKHVARLVDGLVLHPVSAAVRPKSFAKGTGWFDRVGSFRLEQWNWATWAPAKSQGRSSETNPIPQYQREHPFDK